MLAISIESNFVVPLHESSGVIPQGGFALYNHMLASSIECSLVPRPSPDPLWERDYRVTVLCLCVRVVV